MFSARRVTSIAISVLALYGCDSGSEAGGAGCGSNSPADSSGIKKYCSPLLLSYQFDSADNGIIADSSSNRLDLSVTGCALVPGIKGQAIDCSSGGYANTAKTEILSGISENFSFQMASKGEMSAQFWMNYSDNAGADYISSFDGSFAIYLQDNKIHFRPKWPADAGFSTTFSPGVWYNVAITFDGEVARLYVDGMASQEISLISEIGAEHLNDQNMALLPVYYEGHYKGAIDEFKIYDAAISQDAVVGNYNAERI